MSLLYPSAGLATLDSRARDIFRRVVETYLETGEPVGSHAIQKAGVQLSSASIRNTMQQLTLAGLLASPHTSAGRAPTHAGLRLFVDGLLEVGDIGQEERREIDVRLAGMGHSHGANVEEALETASSLLSGLAGGAGIVASPVREAGVRHVEFVALGADQALAVLVADDGTVENRLMPLSAGVTPSTLQEASNFLNHRLKGRLLVDARQEMRTEVDVARRELDEAAARLVEQGLAAWSGSGERDRNLIVRGRGNLLQDARASEDLERVRVLFDDLEQKEQLIGLLDDVGEAQGVRIYIGAETRLFSLSGSAVIAAPYMSGRQRVLGAIGVIGPARLNYARVIPLVDYTARVLGNSGRTGNVTDHNEETRDQLEQDINEAADAVEMTDGAGLEVVDALIAERDQWRDRAMRATAEVENTKRRAETQANDARAYAIQRFAKDLLGVADNLERALQAAPKDGDAATSGLVTGLELVQKSLLSAFENNNLVRVAPEAGEAFDPHFHQAMMEQPSDTVPGGAVIMTLQPGYALFGRTVRAAMVVVAAKGSGGYAGGSNRTGENLDAKA